MLLLLCVVALIALPTTLSAYQKAPTYTITVNTTSTHFFFPQDEGFTAPAEGYYLLQLWGADGGHGYAKQHDGQFFTEGGDGGEVYGYIHLGEGDDLSILVGAAGETAEPNMNRRTMGGGKTGHPGGRGFGGNGATLPAQSGGAGGSSTAILLGDDLLAVAGSGAGAGGNSGQTKTSTGHGGSGGSQPDLMSPGSDPGLYAPGTDGYWKDDPPASDTSGQGGSSLLWNRSGAAAAGTEDSAGTSGGLLGSYSTDRYGGDGGGLGGGGGSGWYSGAGGGGGEFSKKQDWRPGGGGGGSSYLCDLITRDDTALEDLLLTSADAPEERERNVAWSTSGDIPGKTRHDGYVIISYLGTTVP